MKENKPFKFFLIKYYRLLAIFLVFAAQTAAAQQSGKVEVIKDPQIDSLIARRIELSKAARNGSSMTVPGFRVQLFSGISRQGAYSEQARFKSLYPNINSYISYAQPYYKVRVGNFRTRLEAQKLMNQLQQHFPTLFIIAERINPR